MRYCARCVYPENHPLGIVFDDQGVCTGCRVHEEKNQIDWHERGEALQAILNRHRRPRGDNYDCVVPVSGARDSFFIVDTICRRFGLNPLLVTFNRHYNTYAGIFNLEQLRTQIGCDIMSMTLKPESYKRLIRFSLQHLGSVHWPYLAGSTVFPVHIAVSRKIPLIIWGAHQGVDQVGMFSHSDEVEMTRRYRKEHDLMGLEPEDVDSADGLDEKDLEPLFYPSDERLNAVGVRGIYLNNYIRWDTKLQHEDMLARYDYYTGPQLRTFDTYNDVDCRIYSSVHDAIKFRKIGFGKISDHVSREIRFGRMTREQGIALVSKYADAGEGDVAGFAQWLGVTAEEFWAAVDQHRDVRAWEQRQGQWCLKDSVTNHAKDPGVERARLADQDDAGPSFRANRPARMVRQPEDRQLLMRGWAPTP